MKSTAARLLSLVLLLCLLLGVLPLSASAAQVTDDGHVLTDPTLLEKFEFPNNWARPALEFCVACGILQGKENGLASGDYTTRAETAALLVRLLGAEAQNYDISRYTDAKKGAWYYDELAAAVRTGIMSGTSATTLDPNSYITREQVCALLFRAFGIYPEDSGSYLKFSDSALVSSYARNAISALAEKGYLNGYSDGTVRPRAKITRAELAQLLYSLFTCVCDSPEELPSAGRVLYRGTEPVPAGYALDGSLTIGCGLSGRLTLSGLQVSQSLVLRPDNGAAVTLDGCAINNLSVPAAITVDSTSAVSKLFAAGQNSTLNLSAGSAWIYNSCLLTGGYSSLYCQENGIIVTLNGAAESCEIQADNVTLQGSGRAATVTVYGSHSSISLSCGEKIDRSDAYDYKNALNTVETVEIWDTVLEDTYLYTSSSLKSTIRYLPKGTKLLHGYHTAGYNAATVYTADGAFGWVRWSAISVPTTDYTQKEAYSTATMEGFVNQKGYSSSTKYLIWVSLKTQTVNIFSGSKGSWKLIRSCPCATGKNETPTPTGTFSVCYKHSEWDFGTYKVRYVTGFYNGNAFHSRLYSPDFSRLVDASIGSPTSHGCPRLLDTDCAYIYNSIPYRTTVVVY